MNVVEPLSAPASASRASIAAPSRSRSSSTGILSQQLGEEAAHHELAGLGLGDAPGHQVEQLLVVEAAGGAGVAGADDLAGLDLQVGHRVGPGAVGQDQVAVDLVRVGAGRLGPDQHVADPDGVRVVALQGAPVGDVAAAVRHRVVDQQAVLQVLAGVGEVEPVQLGLAAPAGVVDAGVLPDQVAAERHLDVGHLGVAAQPEPDVLGLHRVGGPVGHRDQGQPGAVADEHLDVVGQRGRAGVLQHQRRLGQLGRPRRRCARTRALGAGADQPHRRRLGHHRVRATSTSSAPSARRTPAR